MAPTITPEHTKLGGFSGSIAVRLLALVRASSSGSLLSKTGYARPSVWPHRPNRGFINTTARSTVEEGLMFYFTLYLTNEVGCKPVYSDDTVTL